MTHSPTPSPGGRRERWSSKSCERSTHVRRVSSEQSLQQTGDQRYPRFGRSYFSQPKLSVRRCVVLHVSFAASVISGNELGRRNERRISWGST